MDEKSFVFRCTITESEGVYCALCLDLDIATEGDTFEEAMVNLRDAVSLYIQHAVETGTLEEMVPRPVPDLEKRLKRLDDPDIINLSFGRSDNLLAAALCSA